MIAYGLLLERPDTGLMKLVTSTGPGGVLLRSQEDDLDWYARQLARLPFAFNIKQPAALRAALKRCARRLEKNAERRMG